MTGQRNTPPSSRIKGMKLSRKKLGELFDKSLSNFQEDFRRIIFKHRHPHHHLTVEEIVSEVNMAMLKKKEDIIDSFDGVFSDTEFSKIGYAFAKNSIIWVHGRVSKTAYVYRRSDYSIETEDGVRTSFEIACDKESATEDPACLDSDENEKCSYILKMIKEYCYLLTDHEMKVLLLKEDGNNLRQIAHLLGVSHQAISITEGGIRDKIKSHLSITPFSDETPHKISAGHKSLQSLFESYSKFSDKDRKALSTLLMDNPKRYTSEEISQTFANGKFTAQQICSFCAKNRLSMFLVKKTYKKYSSQEEDLLVKMTKDDCTVEDMMLRLDRNLGSISSKLSHLRRDGLISIYPRRQEKSLTQKDVRLLALFKEGHTSLAISQELGLPKGFISAKRGAFTKKGLLNNASMDFSK